VGGATITFFTNLSLFRIAQETILIYNGMSGSRINKRASAVFHRPAPGNEAEVIN
jgi:hypothetical protein